MGDAQHGFADRARLAEEEALAVVEIVVEQIDDVALGLDALGDEIESETPEQIFEVGRMDRGAGLIGSASKSAAGALTWRTP